MNLKEEMRLRIYTGESDKYEGMPIYRWLVLKARDEKMSGAVVIRGIEGFGKHDEIHAARLLEIASPLPVVVEIIDESQAIEKFLGIIESALAGGMLTIEPVGVRRFGV